MQATDLSDIYRDYIACLNKQDWPKLEKFVHDEVYYNGQQIGISGYREMLERDFHDLLAEWLLALVEPVHRELWKAPFFAGRRLRERHGRQPPAAATASDDIQTANFMISSMFSL